MIEIGGFLVICGILVSFLLGWAFGSSRRMNSVKITADGIEIDCRNIGMAIPFTAGRETFHLIEAFNHRAAAPVEVKNANQS